MGPSPDLLDSNDYTPLHWAAYNGHDNCVELLLEHDKRKATYNFIGNTFTPLHCAVYVPCSSLLQALSVQLIPDLHVHALCHAICTQCVCVFDCNHRSNIFIDCI